MRGQRAGGGGGAVCRTACGVAVALCAWTAGAADPWADAVVSYDAGSGAIPGYQEPATMVGSPERYTGELGGWPQAVTPFNPAWGSDEIVSIGAGGQITLRFDEALTNDPGHPFGVDLLVFGNSFFADAEFPAGVVGGLFENGPFNVSVSADGSVFVPLAGSFANALFPTLGYMDTAAQDPSPGMVLTDFLRPVDPAIGLDVLIGKSYPELLALYGGSGGGVPVDIASSGLDEIYYVRLDVPAGASGVAFDALAAVPEPTACVSFAFVFCTFAMTRGRAGVWKRVLASRAGPCRAEVWRRMLARASTPLTGATRRLFRGGTPRLSPVLLMLTLTGAATYAAPWTHFAGDAARAGVAPAGPVELGEPAWIALPPAGTEFVCNSSPVVCGGRVFVKGRRFSGSTPVSARVLAYNSKTGQELWVQDVDLDYYDDWSSPAVDLADGTVIVGAGYRLHALDVATGEIRWQRQLERRIVNASPAVSHNLIMGAPPADRVFVTDYSGAGSQARLYAINVSPYQETINPFQPGEIAWSASLPGASGATPAYADGFVFAATKAGIVYAFDGYDGSQRWQTDVAAAGYPEYAGFYGGVSVRDGYDGYVYAASYRFYGSGNNSGLFKLHADSGEIAWVVPCERTDSTPVVTGDGRIFLAGGVDWSGSATKIQAFQDHGTYATLLWDTDVASGGTLIVGGWTHQPAFAGGLLYAGTPSDDYFSPYTELLILDTNHSPAEPGFVMAGSAQAGGSPAPAGGWLYSLGQAGLVAFARRMPGDVNCDGAINVFDIDPFVLALSDPPAYSAAYPDCDRDNADANEDGDVNVFDIDPFVSLLTG
jgi:outer membrane protein assembly factor BamB